jgi:signal transduction histidine kinase
VGVIVTGRDHKVIISNRNADNIFGESLPVANTSSPGIWETFHPHGQPLKEQEHPLWRAIHTGKPVPPAEYLYRGSDDEMRWIRIAAAPIIGTDGEVSGGVAALSEIDREKRAEAALIKSEKLAAVGRLAASISHEINNPLEAVTNLLYLVQQSSRETNAFQFAIQAQEQLARVSQIVTQTLRFHRQSSSPQSVAVSDLVEPTLALYRGRMANLNIRLKVQYRADARIFCREGDVRQVLNNLIGNAIDAMREGGRLIVRTTLVHDGKSNDSGVRVSIADTGHGIPAEVMKHIFEPFYTTKGDSGTGLGLWISQEIIARSRGRLKIRSKPAEHNGGTVASVFLPVTL